jgi:hypothetical protein
MSTVIVVMLSLVLLVIVVGNVVLWGYQMNQLDWEKIQERVELANVTRVTRSSWVNAENEYSIITGSVTSGTYMATTVLDDVYESFREELQSGDSYHPSAYTLGGATSYVSGNTINLGSNDNEYMSFSSYISGSSNISLTDAFVAYRDSTTTLNSPKERTWVGANAIWSSQSEFPTSSSPVRWVRVAYCPIEARCYEKIVVTLSNDGYLDSYVWNVTSKVWNVTNDIGFVGTTANDRRPFDVAYEKTSGEILLVWGVSDTDTTHDLAYRSWSYSAGWSAIGYIDDTGHSTNIQYYWVELASNPISGSNEITMVALDNTDSDANGWVWNGASWGLIRSLDENTAIGTKECVAVAYEQLSGRAWTAVGSGTLVNTFTMRSQIGGSWNNTTESPNIGGVPNWCTLKADPASNKLMLVSIDSSLDLNVVYYNGASSWVLNYGGFTEDAAVDTTGQRCADFAWEPSGSKGLIVWGTTSDKIKYQAFDGTNWGTASEPDMGTHEHPWVQLRTNPRPVAGGVKILGTILEASALDIGTVSWDGSTFTIIGTNTISSDTTVIAYECFDVEFMNFGTPEFTCEVELSGTANTNSWTQLNWMTELSFTIADVTTTLQTYNYNAHQYPTSGDGYMTDTIGQTDTIKNQILTTSPSDYRDAGGNWKIKIKGTKITDTQFEMRIDWTEFKATSSNVYRLNINNDFPMDLVTYPRQYLRGIEIMIRYNTSEISERWFLRAYNWETDLFSDINFNSTGGSQPILNEWSEYTITVTDNWSEYVRDDGVIRIEFSDEGLTTNQTTVGIDYLAVRAIIDAARVDVKNSSPLSLHIVAIWITNSTLHQRYEADLFMNSGESISYLRTDIGLPENDLTARVVTERGNAAVFSNP